MNGVVISLLVLDNAVSFESDDKLFGKSTAEK